MRVSVPALDVRSATAEDAEDDRRLIAEVLEDATEAEPLNDALRAGCLRRYAPDGDIPMIGPLPKGSSWVPDATALDYVLKEAEAFSSRLGHSTDALRTWESGLAAKMTLQRGALPLWFIPDKPYRNRKSGTKWRMIERVLEYAWRTGGEEVYRSTAPTPYRRGTNHGGSTQRSSDMDLLLRAYMAGYALGDPKKPGPDAQKRLSEIYADVARTFGAPEKPFATLFSRSGPTAKAQKVKIANPNDDAIYVGGRATSAAPKRRHVKGPPSEFNIAVREPYRALTSIIKALGLWHGRIEEINTIVRGWLNLGNNLLDDDVSGMDDSVSLEELRAVSDTMTRLMPEQAPAWAIWQDLEALPILTGHPLRRGRAILLPSEGTVTSGDLLTSAVDTLVNLCRCLRIIELIAVARDGLIWYTERRRHEGAAPILVWGDDTIVSTRTRLDTTLWKSASASLGYESKPGNGHSFLMQWHTTGGAFGSAARAVQQTYGNEEGGRAPIIELLGAVGRCQPLAQSPFRAWAEGLIFSPERSSTMRAYDATSYERAVKALTSERAREEIRALGVQAELWIADMIVPGRPSAAGEQVLRISQYLLGRPPANREVSGAMLSAIRTSRADVMELASAMAATDEDQATRRVGQTARNILREIGARPNPQ